VNRVKQGWCVEFTEESLRAFYLLDVLLHELGHHVDERVWSRDVQSAERFAEWFAGERSRLLHELGGPEGEGSR